MLTYSVEYIKKLAKEKSVVTVKYVNVNGDYRFNFPDNLSVSHSDMVKEGEKPTSAGFFTLTQGDLFLQEMCSTTLNLGPHDDDGVNLRQLFLE